MSATKLDQLLTGEVRVINIGLTQFAEDLERAGIRVVQLDWSPPATSNARIASLLGKLGA